MYISAIDRNPEDANLLEGASSSFAAIPVSERHREVFYDLIQEQAATHASPDDEEKKLRNCFALFSSVVERRDCEAFLVTEDNGLPVTAVTFYPCHNGSGRGLYLEDIVTTKSHRGCGAGSFALATLAQIALKRRWGFVALECMAHNAAAQDFYTYHGASVNGDLHTWRIMPRPADDEAAKTQAQGVFYTTLRPENFQATLNFLTVQNKGRSANLASMLTDVAARRDPMFAVAERRTSSGSISAVVGFSSAYRSFSTFRVVSGLHINRLAVDRNDGRVAIDLLNRMMALQARNGWMGHTDVTVSEAHGRAWLEPVLTRAGFAPLAYGRDKMVVRSFGCEVLRHVAGRYGARDLTASLTL